MGNILPPSEVDFYHACLNNDIDEAKIILKKFDDAKETLNISDDLFFDMCCYGHNNIIRWLIKTCNERKSPIDIRYDDDIYFLGACAKNQSPSGDNDFLLRK